MGDGGWGGWRGRMTCWRAEGEACHGRPKSNCWARYCVWPGRHCRWREGGPSVIDFYKQYGLDVWFMCKVDSIQKGKLEPMVDTGWKTFFNFGHCHLRSNIGERVWNLVFVRHGFRLSPFTQKVSDTGKLNLCTSMNLWEGETQMPLQSDHSMRWAHTVRGPHHQSAPFPFCSLPTGSAQPWGAPLKALQIWGDMGCSLF